MCFDLNTSQYRAIVIGGSAGSFPIITKILSKLPVDFPLPIFMAMHRLKHIRHGFQEALELKSIKPVIEPNDKQNIRPGEVYLAPANYHLCLELGNTLSLSTEPVINNSRPAIDLTFETASYVYKQKLIGILLSGANKDGAWGMKKIKDRGGMTIIQDPNECVIDTMPVAAQKITSIDYTLSVDKIIEFLIELNNTKK